MKDSKRRDFTINSIYADKEGNLFDPFNGKKDLEDGKINFIGDVETRIKEDYLRVLRYIRFFLKKDRAKDECQISLHGSLLIGYSIKNEKQCSTCFSSNKNKKDTINIIRVNTKHPYDFSRLIIIRHVVEN